MRSTWLALQAQYHYDRNCRTIKYSPIKAISPTSASAALIIADNRYTVDAYRWYSCTLMENDDLAFQQRRRRFSMVLLVCLCVIGYGLFQSLQSNQPIDEPTADPSVLSQRIASGEYTRAIEALGQLAVAGRVSQVGYDRSKFSQGWADYEGCDMRNRILQRDLVDTILDKDNCIVLRGTLKSGPYSGKDILFERGVGTSGAIHIEHVVAVSDAWQKGAQDLSRQERRQFYNDPLNLIAVDGPTNQDKGSQDASAWLPQRSYRCRYIARQIAVKLRYSLWLSPPEHQAMQKQLQTCPLQVLPIQKEE